MYIYIYIYTHVYQHYLLITIINMITGTYHQYIPQVRELAQKVETHEATSPMYIIILYVYISMLRDIGMYYYMLLCIHYMYVCM